MNDEELIQAVIATTNSTGWTKVMQPTYARRARQALTALALSPSERESGGGDFAKMDDAQLRAIIRECEWMLAIWTNTIRTYNENRVRDELAGRENGALSPLIPAANP